MDWKTAVARDDFERAIADLPFEVAGVFDADGNRLFAKPGDADQVGFTRSELARLPGTVLVHNHPNGSSLSYTDAVFAEKNGLAEIVAVVRFQGKPVRFSLRPSVAPDSKLTVWPPFSELQFVCKPAIDRLDRQWRDAYLDGTFSLDYAEHWFMHEFWEGQRDRIHQRYGVFYEYLREEL